ncbi:MAG: hypothetical protein KDC38_08790, partial [Planctomycetes bacterium]|nr:hypothetical protein [Planctomycetota bacterium]
VVSRTGFNEEVGDVCYRYRGRRNLCVIVESDRQSWRTILSATDVVDVVDELSQVHRDDSPIEAFCGGFYGGGLSREQMAFATGIPQFDLEIVQPGREPERVVIRVELRDEPDVATARREADRVREALFENLPRLCDDLHDFGIQLDVQVLGPGGITSQGRDVVVV